MPVHVPIQISVQVSSKMTKCPAVVRGSNKAYWCIDISSIGHPYKSHRYNS